ncbi:LOW QUALITY PROTEIN: LIM and SH3 domain protein 1 [Catharus ustulatus]|uniref:LOW QUALITY PROTEIN: LIM and SH3 domain protein 1 n=1 Tax=Catharus ustulatus TaxID=91951 RepID=UPI00140BB171|nr:LOW QUALITY PROTEIN: LIM and SH3 domain protein 1 [Catharus ustulatus]
MNPNCARCGKIVYPTEKVNCLDKFWHKSCFHCETCKMTLNMKNYKGYDKKPYCNAHYPKQSFTMVADTPENLRLKQQSELQSQIRYKEEFEKNKGQRFQRGGDTPELQRIRKTQDQIQQRECIKYHEEFERSRMGPSPSEGSEPERRGSPESGGYRRAEPQQQQQQLGQPGATVYQQPPSQSYGYKEPAAPASAPRNAPPGGGKRFRAVYDYNAADEDEVSFQDGDTIINVQQIDDGWMYGTVERTGDTGMLPANYVEAI